MDISVIIPTHNRLDVLKLNLEALATQELGDYEAEIVVVDNGSDDATVDWVIARATRFPYPLRVEIETTPGVSAARNRGVALSQGELLLSINDDTVPADDSLIVGHIEAHRESRKPLAVLGRIGYPDSLLRSDPFMAWLERGPQFDFEHLEAGLQPLPNHYYTAHLSLTREQFLAAGGMDERLRFGFEDAEFGYRLASSGTGLLYRGDLRLIHHHPMDLSAWRRRNERMGAAAGRVNQIHPINPPLAGVPDGLSDRLCATTDSVLALLPTDWRWAPRQVRDRVYGAVFRGAYRRGYRRELGDTR
jgi:GT2 family glycosyltransferase